MAVTAFSYSTLVEADHGSPGHTDTEVGNDNDPFKDCHGNNEVGCREKECKGNSCNVRQDCHESDDHVCAPTKTPTPTNTPRPTETSTPTSTPTATAPAGSTATPTATATGTATSTPTPTNTPQPELRTVPNPTATPTATPVQQTSSIVVTPTPTPVQPPRALEITPPRNGSGGLVPQG